MPEINLIKLDGKIYFFHNFNSVSFLTFILLACLSLTHCTFIVEKDKQGGGAVAEGPVATGRIGAMQIDLVSNPVAGPNEDLWSGTFRGGGHYDVIGSVIARVDATGGIRIVLQNDFKSDKGKGLYLYLSSASNNITDSVLLAKLLQETTAQTYTIPDHFNIKLADRPYLLVWCKPFAALFGYAGLTKQ